MKVNLAVCGILLLGCGSPEVDPSSPVLEVTGHASTARNEIGEGGYVPQLAASHAENDHCARFKMKYSGTLTPPEIVSSAPPTAFILATASGRASRMGQITVAYPHYLNLEDGSFSGIETVTAANGDRLTIDLKGQSIPVGPNEFDLTLSGSITGGTGRFSAAAGSLTGTGHASLNTLTVSASLAGRLSLHGHDQDVSDEDD